MKGKGEGGRGEGEEEKGLVFLTFRMVTGRARRLHRPVQNLTITKTHRPTQGEKNAPGSIEDELLPGNCRRPLPPRDKNRNCHTRLLEACESVDIALALSLLGTRFVGPDFAGFGSEP